MTVDNAQEMCYLARKACGCLTMVIMERSPMAAAEVAKAIRHGETVDRILPADIPDAAAWRCSEHPRKGKP